MRYNKHLIVGLAATWFGGRMYDNGVWFGALLIIFGLFELWHSQHDGQPPLSGA